MNRLFQRFSIRAQLLTAFAIDIVLLVALGSFATVQMANMSQNAAFVEQYTIPTLDLSDQINSLITQYRARQFELLINSSTADQARIQAEMGQIEAQMQATFRTYAPLVSSEAERIALEGVFAAWDAFVVATRERFIPAIELSGSGTVQPAFNRLNPLYRDLTSAADRLIAESQRQANTALSAVRMAFTNARNFIIGDTIVTVIISAGAGFVIAGRLARRVRRLTRATRDVADGDLSQLVELGGRDEVGELARNFNLMIYALRAERQNLRERNEELGRSLAEQQRLMEEVIARQAEQAAAERARAAAEAASQAKTMFIATMSHELRTPLNAILGYAQLLHLRAQATADAGALHQLGRIEIAGKHLLTLVSNILDFSKIEQGHMERDIQAFSLFDLIQMTVTVVEPLASERGNRLELICDPAIGTMQSDPSKLRQILFNLLSNAGKFTENGTISLHVSAVGDLIELVVADTGIGMTEEQLARIFEPFTQADSSTTRRFGGTGLGLTLSRELVLLLGGTIAVASTPAVGTQFTVSLPRHLAPQAHPTHDQTVSAEPIHITETRKTYADDLDR